VRVVQFAAYISRRKKGHITLHRDVLLWKQVQVLLHKWEKDKKLNILSDETGTRYVCIYLYTYYIPKKTDHI
jgi:hypothetical protein